MTDETRGARVVDKHRFEAQVAGAVARVSNHERRGPKIDLTHIERHPEYLGLVEVEGRERFGLPTA